MSSIDPTSHLGESSIKPKSKRRSKEKILLEGLPLLSRGSSIEKKEISSPRAPEHKRHAQLMMELPRNQTDSNLFQSFSFSPRTNPQAIQETAHQIQVLLPQDFPVGLTQVLSQIAHNQYVFISLEYEDLAAGLDQKNWIGPFFLAVEILSSPNSPFPKIRARRLWEAALRVIQNSKASILSSDESFNKAIESILVQSENLKSPKFQDLVLQAKEKLSLHTEDEQTAKDLASKGLSLISRNLASPLEQETFTHCKLPYEEGPKNLQKAFLISAQTLCFSEDKHWIHPEHKKILFEIALRVLISPIDQTFYDNSEIRKLIDYLLTPEHFPEMQYLKDILTANLKKNTPALTQLQFLLFWVQNDCVETKENLDLIAGTREWDPEGELFLFAADRFFDLANKVSYDADFLARWIHFFHCYRQAPANRDLIYLPEFKKRWFKILEILAKHEELKNALGDVFLTECGRIKPPPKIWPLDRIQSNPLYQAPPLSASFWKKESAAENFRSSLLFYLLSSYSNISLRDLIRFSKEKSPSVLLHTKRFNRTLHFIVEQMLACGSALEIQQIVKVLCSVQKELLSSFAFEPAAALHAVFQQASITRLEKVFADTDGFHALFQASETPCARSKNAQALRRLQAQHPTSFEVFSITLQDLTHLRDNPLELREDGNINLDRLQQFGSLFNRFTLRRDEAALFWFSEEHLFPSSFVIKEFEAQSGEENEELERKWYERSQEIRPIESKSYWGEEL